MEDNLSCVLYGPKDMKMEQRPIPVPGKNEVLLKMSSVGICGSDVHYYQTGRCGPFVVVDPMVLGHEASGIVAKCGEGVKHLKPGDRVAIEPGVPCRMCEHCKKGVYNLCPDIFFCATPPDDGSLCRYYKHAADFCYKLPPNVTMEEAALLEPLSVAVHACRRAGVSAAHKVVIGGAGPIGLVNLMTAKAMGATCVLITDISEHRLNVAKSLGADYTVNIGGLEQKKLMQNILDTLQCEPDVSIECSGAESSVQLLIQLTKSGGTFLQVGMGAENMTIPFMNASVREVDIKGVFRYANCYPTALSLVSSGKVNLKALITHRFPLDQSAMAFETSRTGEGGAIKVVIKCSDDI